MTDRNIKVGVEVDASDAKKGMNDLGVAAQDMSRKVKKAGEEAGQGLGKVGEGSEQASEKIDRTSKSIIQSIQRTTVALESGGRTTAKYYETIANQRGVSVDALRPYLEQLKAVETAQGKFTQSSGAAVNSLNNVGISAKQTAAAMRNVPAQFTDIVTSLQGGQAPLTVLLQQGGQLKDMFGGIGNAAGALGKYILGLVNPYTVAAAAIGAVAFAYSKANDTAQEFAKTLIVSGNAAGTTTDQMISLANAISAAGAGSVKSANEAVNALVSTGKVSYSVLEQATLAVVKSQNLLGKSVEETSKEFADLAKSPTKSIIDLNEKYNFLTLDIYKQIKALEDQGRATEAAKLAQSTYAEVLLGNSAKVNETLTDWERGWNRIKKATSDAADAALRVFDQDTNEEQIKKLFKVRDDLEKSQASLVGDKSFLNLGQAERVQAALDANKAEINAIRDKQKATLDAAKAQEEKNKADAAGIKFTEQGTEFLSKSAKMTRELDAATRLYLAGRTEANKRTEQDAELQTRLGQIREKYKETISKEENAYKSLSMAISEKLQLSILDLNTEKPLTEAQKLRVKLMEAIEKGHGKITQAQIAEESRKIELIRSNELMKQSYEGLRKEIEKFKPALTAADVVSTISKQDKAYADLISTQEAYRQSLNDSADLMQIEASLMGQSATDRNTAIEQYKIQIALKKELLKIEEDINLTQAQKDERSDVARENANIAKSQAALKVQQGEWSKFYQDIYNGLTDSLYRGFEAGKGFFQSFWDGIKNLFKTTVLKLAVQGVVTGVLGAAGVQTASASGLGSAASAFNTGKSLWDGFKAAGTIGGGIAAGAGGVVTGLGNLVGSQSIAALGSGLGMSTAAAGEAAAIYTAAGNTAVAGGLTTGASINAALAAIPVWGWAALGTAALAAAFGGGKERVTGQQSISGTLGTNNLSRDVPFTKSGGLFGKSDAGVWNYNLATSAAIASNGRSYTDTASQASDTAMLQQLNSNYAALQEAAKGYASILGLSADAVTAVSDRINFNLGKTKEETEAAMQSAFGQIANDITNRLAPSISAFSKEGEQVSATMARLAGSLLSVNEVLGQNGFTKFAQTLEGGNAAARLAELTGGIEKLASGAQYFFENFLTDAEKIKPSMELVSSTMAGLGQSSVDTIEEFKNLVQGLDLSTQSGAEMYAKLIEIAPQFKAVADYARILNGELTETERVAKEAADAIKLETDTLDQRKSLQDEYNRLTMTSAQFTQMQRDALFESNRALFDNIQAVQAKQAADAQAAEEAKAIAAQRITLQDELDQLVLTEAQLLEKKRATYYQQNRDIFDQIQAEKERISQAQEAARLQDEAAKQAQDAANKIAEAWKGLSNSVFDEIRRIRGLMTGSGVQNFATAQSDFAIATAQSRAGDQNAYKLLPDLSKALLTIAEQQAPTLQALRMIQAQTAASLMETSKKLGFQLPSFAVGTEYVPYDMVAKVHQGERIVTAQDNQRSSDTDNKSYQEMIDEVKMLRSVVNQLVIPTLEIEKNSRSTRNMIASSTEDGSRLVGVER